MKLLGAPTGNPLNMVAFSRSRIDELFTIFVLSPGLSPRVQPGRAATKRTITPQ